MLLESSFAEEATQIQRKSIVWDENIGASQPCSIIKVKLTLHSNGSGGVSYAPDPVLYVLHMLSHQIPTRPHEVGAIMMLIYTLSLFYIWSLEMSNKGLRIQIKVKVKEVSGVFPSHYCLYKLYQLVPREG